MSAPLVTVHVPIVACPVCGTRYLLVVSWLFNDGQIRTELLYQRDLRRGSECRKSHEHAVGEAALSDVRTAPVKAFAEPMGIE